MYVLPLFKGQHVLWVERRGPRLHGQSHGLKVRMVLGEEDDIQSEAEGLAVSMGTAPPGWGLH